ncbi:hypothetical protein AMIS_32340 [Actinoplanes missouriensis 431]|uniref:Uncharacterized protein n=1 Tax=Actinoplanes missouriensis (strain ATCC 14538 / DSM 43046 / CBS 188.64 / JCM 3121 / NBRC 102363 / NCIMB 12654 / NRRL B-3342 / UNCC 431) TaxID=512565 RepID=I0H617_ACTM4|nr:hypothetical protein [Actinoplanes missouriensis]BAL88454.1 hypothetical protein AMIS_32340 [Actinoplanes missouriensis 431]
MTAEPLFHLLRPEHLPSPAAVAGYLRTRGGVLSPAIGHRDDAQALDAVRAAVTAVPMAAGTVVDGPDDAESAGNRDNDQAFGIVRVDGDRPALFVHTVLKGYEALLADTSEGGTDLTGEQWRTLREALGVMLEQPPQDRLAQQWQPMPRRRDQPPSAALRRWVRGHRLFMVLIQGLVQASGELAGQLRAGDRQPVAALERAILLMRASEVALRFAGDFSIADYDAVVRPTLMPPHSPPGMSGLHWRDHEHLIANLAAARDLLAGVDPALTEMRATFRRAYAEVYDAHRFVCARFVGEESASLLMAKSKQSAVAVLDRYKQARLHNVPQ